MGRLGWRGWRWGVQNVVVTGDEVGVGLIGHGELLHGARLDQLLREGGGNVLGGAVACDEGHGLFHPAKDPHCTHKPSSLSRSRSPISVLGCPGRTQHSKEPQPSL